MWFDFMYFIKKNEVPIVVGIGVVLAMVGTVVLLVEFGII